jgi:hypothetical protein
VWIRAGNGPGEKEERTRRIPHTDNAVGVKRRERKADRTEQREGEKRGSRQHPTMGWDGRSEFVYYYIAGKKQMTAESFVVLFNERQKEGRKTRTSQQWPDNSIELKEGILIPQKRIWRGCRLK